jgi:hypothetical protein
MSKAKADPKDVKKGKSVCIIKNVLKIYCFDDGVYI